MKRFLILLVLLSPLRFAYATALPAPGRSLAEALNPDGSLKAGLSGSFDARQFRMNTAPDGRPVFRPAGTKGAGDEGWADGFEWPGVDGRIAVVARAGTNVYIAGSFTMVGNVPAQRVARWNGTVWSPLGTGIGNSTQYSIVNALAVAGNGDVYAGGNFTTAGGVAANYVARWNGTTWSPLGSGVGSTASTVVPNINSLAVAGNGDVYAGGSFTTAGGVAANYVARWNGTAWSALGTGAANGVSGGRGRALGGATYSTVYALAVAGNGDVFAGGDFTQAGGAAANQIARWNGTAWSTLGTGVSGSFNSVGATVYALGISTAGDVYAGGDFTQAGGAAANGIARWNGTAWNSVNTGAANGVNSTVWTLAVSGTDVYVGGSFSQAGGVAAGSVAKWDGTAWSSLGTGAANGVSARVDALAVASNGQVYVGGLFEQAGAVRALGLAKWDGTVWSRADAGAGNGQYGIKAVAIAPNGDVYVGGNFGKAGGVTANRVAKWDGTAWSSLGTGAANGVNWEVYALAVAPNGDVYVGGNFTQAGGITANRVARWNGTTWNSLGTGAANGVGVSLSSEIIYALAVAPNGDVYVGGFITQAGGTAANRIAKWNGTTWNALGTGITNGTGYAVVQALAVAPNGDVYAGGNFTQAGGVPANCVAKWNGTAWNSLGTGPTNGIEANLNSFGNTLFALAVAANGDVYVGGIFPRAGGVTANHVAKWDGATWSALSTGLSFSGLGGAGVNALAAAPNGGVYVGGYITQAGGITANNVAKWDGAAWSSLGTGLNESVSTLAFGPTGKLYAGGHFTATGDGSKIMAGFASYNPNAPLAAAAARAKLAAQLFPNPAHGAATLRLPAGAPRLPLTLVDAQGRTVRRYPAPATAEAALDLRGLPAGTYLVRCGQYAQRLVVE